MSSDLLVLGDAPEILGIVRRVNSFLTECLHLVQGEGNQCLKSRRSAVDVKPGIGLVWESMYLQHQPPILANIRLLETRHLLLLRPASFRSPSVAFSPGKCMSDDKRTTSFALLPSNLYDIHSEKNRIDDTAFYAWR